MHQAKILVLPFCVTDRKRDTERLSIMPQVIQLLRTRWELDPWLNLASRCCDDTEGVAETEWRRPVAPDWARQTHTHTHTHARVLLRLQKSEENRWQPGEDKGESRSIRNRGHTAQEAREFSSLMSQSETLDCLPWTQELTVQWPNWVGSRFMPSQGFSYHWTPLLSVIRAYWVHSLDFRSVLRQNLLGAQKTCR